VESRGGKNVKAIVFCRTKKRTAYVTFDSIESASKVREALNRKICHDMGSKVLSLDYVERMGIEEKIVRDSNIECTSKTYGVDVPGLTIVDNFVSPEEEKDLLRTLDRNSYWKTHLSRRVAHFQYSFDYEMTEIDRDSRDKTPDIPKLIQNVANRIENLTNNNNFHIDQVTANEYLPRQGIAPHIDTIRSFTGIIVSLCLSSGCVFTLRHVRTGIHKSIYHRPRSLIIMTGPARFEFQHYIAPRKGDVVDGKYIPRSRRVSLTFRQILQVGVEMESKHVDAFYEIAAPHFTKTRVYPWPQVESYIQDMLGKSSDIHMILDVGCGNGRYVKCCISQGLA
jgi:alkylated DNA repair protein alkB homolog 8